MKLHELAVTLAGDEIGIVPKKEPKMWNILQIIGGESVDGSCFAIMKENVAVVLL